MSRISRRDFGHRGRRWAEVCLGGRAVPATTAVTSPVRRRSMFMSGRLRCLWWGGLVDWDRITDSALGASRF